MFYAEDKKRVRALLATHGLQLPARLQTSNFNNSITKNFKSQDLFDSPGLQLPDEIQHLDSNIIIRKTRAKVNTLDKNSSRDDIRYSHKDKITIDSTEQERYEILKNKVLKNIPIITKQSDLIQSWEDIDKIVGKEKSSLIKKIATEFNVFKEYNNIEFDVSFNFSRRNYEESYGKQKHNFTDFAKMFTVFDEVVNNAIGVEVHNKNKEGYKVDPTLKNVYVLVSAFQDGECIIPVKLEIKEFNDKQNTLYVAISLNKIKTTEVSGQGNTTSGVTQYSRSVANISIYCFLKKVNT